MKRKLSTIILIFILIAGLSLLLYPTVSDYWNSLHQSKAIASYADDVSYLDEKKYEELWQAVRKYNESIIHRKNVYLPDEDETAEYESLLNISETGVMGYIDIPAINCSLPICHGTDEFILQTSVGHLEWSSLPSSENGTHCVLSGHRGLPSSKLFTDLDKLEKGDIFILRVLDKILTYEVDQILIVEPNETDSLRIEDGKNYCTLVTCTPFAVNSHRLLLRGHLIKNPESASLAIVTSDAIQIEPLIVAPIVAVLPMLILLIILSVQGLKKKRNRGGKANEAE